MGITPRHLSMLLQPGRRLPVTCIIRAMTRSAATSTARRCFAILTIVALLTAAACFGGERFERYLAEQIPFAATRFETDLIFPSPESARYLAVNWAPAHPWSTGTVYPEGTSATIRFFSVSDVPPTFVAEAMRVDADSPPQTMTLLLNGQSAGTASLGSDWATYETALPGSALRVGWNDLELRFTTTVPWPASQPDRPAPPPRAARFRKIEMRPGLGRPYEPERPAAAALADLDARSSWSGVPIPIELAPDRFEDFSSAAIDMAADSLLEIFVLPAPGARLAGEAAVDSDQTGEMTVVVEIVDGSEPTRIWEASLAEDEERSVAADLGPWAGKLVRLRMRVFGTMNGTVRWTGLRTVSSTEPPDAPDRVDLRFLLDPTGAAERYGAAVRPDEALAPPRSGILGRPDIFLIVLDAARADRFEGPLGDELAPHVRALAGEGTAFSQAWAASSWTGQSIPALLAGMYPDAIGIEDWASRLHPEAVTFPELLQAAGYHTALWSHHPIYSRRPELRGGFEAYENAAPMATEDPATLPDVAALLDGERPTFAMIHLLPPHSPYTPPAPFAGSRSSWYSGDVPITDEILNQFDLRFSVEQSALRDEIRRAAIARYEENVRFADHLVGRLVDELRRAGRYDDALIIVTADHGEAFYEHGIFLHNQLLFEELVRVPLVVKWPATFAPSTASVAAPVSLVDLAPSLVDGLGVADDFARFQGRSLLPLVAAQEARPRLLYAYTSGTQRPEAPPQPQYALRWEDLKLIHVGRTDRTALYRLSDDPGEQVDIADRETTYVRWLSGLLRSVQAHNAGLTMEAGGIVTEELDPETIRRLRALGYLR